MMSTENPINLNHVLFLFEEEILKKMINPDIATLK